MIATRIAVACILTFFAYPAFAASVSSDLTVEGRLYDSNGIPYNSKVDMILQLVSENTPSCVLYEESQLSLDVSSSTPSSAGVFALRLGNGAVTPISGGAGLSGVFINGNTFTGKAGCTASTSPGEHRLVHIQVSVNGAGAYEALNPDTMITSVPTAIVAETSNTLSGHQASDFLLTNTTSDLSQNNLEQVFSTFNFPKLQNLLSGTSTQYLSATPVTAVNLNNQLLNNVATPVSAADAANKNYVDTTIGGKALTVTGVGLGTGGGKTLVWDAVGNQWTTGTSVSYVGTGAGLVSGPISSTGTLKVDVGTGAGQIVQLTPSAGLPAIDAFLLTNIGTASLKDSSVTLTKLNTFGASMNSLLMTDMTGSHVNTITCLTNQILQYTATGWSCANIGSAIGSQGPGASTYGSGLYVPQITVDAQGRVAALTNVNIAFPVTSVNGLSGAVNITPVSLGLGTAALDMTGTSSGEIPVLDQIGLPAVDGSRLTNLNASRFNGSSTITVQYGGTGATSLTAHGVLVGENTGSIASVTGAAGMILQTQTASDPIFTANPVLGVNASLTGKLGLANGSVGGATTTVAANASTLSPWTFTLPLDGGSNHYVLQTDGLGNTSWTAQAGSGTVNSGSTNQLAYYAASGTVLGGLTSVPNALLTTNASGVPSWSAISTDTFSQYALIAGRSGGQVLTGGMAANENLTLNSTSNTTKGFVLLAPSGGNVGINNSTPGSALDVSGTINSSAGYSIGSIQALAYNSATSSIVVGNGTTTGNNNSVIGVQALQSGTPGNFNSAMGSQALKFNIGSNNTAVGAQALMNSTSGSQNTALGYGAGKGLTNGTNNVALGYNSGSTLTTGTNNVILGPAVGSTTLSTGSGNILIGTGTAVDTLTPSASNSMNIGNTIFGDLTNHYLGIAAPTPQSALDLNGSFTLRGMAAPLVAPAGEGRIYFDSTSNTLQVSQNSGAYSPLVTATAAQTFTSDITMSGPGIGLTVTNSEAINGTLTVAGMATMNGGVTLPANQNLNMTLGTGQLTQIYTGSGPAQSISDTGSGNILQLSSTSTSASNNDAGIKLNISGLNGTSSITRYGVYSTVTATGPISTNVGGYFSASAGTNNYGLLVASGSVGIGTTSPSSLLDVQGSNTSTTIHIANNSSSTAQFPALVVNDYTGGNGGAPELVVQNARGTSSAPSPLQGGDSLGYLLAGGQYDSVVGHFGYGAALNFMAEGTYSSTSYPTAIAFLTVPSGSTSPQERLHIANSGNVGIGTTSPQSLVDLEASDASPQLTIANSTSTGARYPGLTIVDFGTAVGGNSVMTLESSRGTPASAQPTQAGDILGSIRGIPQTNTSGGATFGTANGASIDFVADGNATPISTPVGMRFNINKPGSTTRSESFRVSASGNVAFKGNTTQAVVVTGTLQPSSIDFDSGTVQVLTNDCSNSGASLLNLREGGSYTIIVQRVAVNTAACTFNNNLYVDGVLEVASAPFRFLPANGSRTANTDTIYNLFRANGIVYVTWTPGFQ